jgi:serine/threonine-protein kinase
MATVLRVGESVGGYDIVAKLRAGGMATLFLGKKKGAAGFSRHVAIKVIHEHLAQDPDFVRMFVDEALLQARIQNPHVVHVEELGEAEGAHFLVMEYVHGCALAQLLLALGKRKRRPQVDIAVSVALQTLSGLHAAHELRGENGQALGVVHRDVSPQNVLLSHDGHVKLIDFGVAKAASSSQQTQGAMLKGKLRYMPPEQAFGRAVDRRADVYALGIVLWEMLTMRKLFGAQDDLSLLEMVRNPQIDPPSTWAPEVPAALDRVVLKALSKDPKDRFATAQEMRRALTEAVPSAALVEPSAIAELMAAAVGDELEKERRALPAALGAQVTRPETTQVHIEEVLLTLTVSASGLEVKSGTSPISGSMADYARTGEGATKPLVAPGETPAPAPVSSQAIGTPSQPQGGLAATLVTLEDNKPKKPGATTERILPRPPSPSRPPYALFAIGALFLVGAVGGGAYWIRSRASTDEMIASPLPVRSAVGAPAAVEPAVVPPAPVEPTSIPVAPDPSVAPAPTPGAPAAAPSASASPTSTGSAPSAPAGDENPTVEPVITPTPRGSGPRRDRTRRVERRDGDDRSPTVPFASEF